MVAVERCCLFLLTTMMGTGTRILNQGGTPAPSTSTSTSTITTAIVPLIQDLRFRILRLHGEFLGPDGGTVDYNGLVASDDFHAYVHAAQQLQWADAEEVAALSEAERRATWLNLYNALVMHALAVGPVPASSLARSRFFRSTAYRVAGLTLSLDDLEHGLLRNDRASPNPLRWGFWSARHFILQAADDPRRAWAVPLDPRIHFALNCGALSCPAIRFYEAGGLDEELRAAAEAFLAGTKVNATTRTVQLSMILKWYQRDFVPDSSSATSTPRELAMLRTVLPWLPLAVRDQLQEWLSDGRGVRVTYAPYDWGINAK